jgi:hypothetical protein
VLTALRGILAAAALALAGQTTAATYSYVFLQEFSGAQAPGGPAPWATLSFADVAGGVEMTITLSAMGGTEFAGDKGLHINFGPNPGDSALDTRLSDLSFAFLSGQDVSADVSVARNAFKADGDGKFDILFHYAESGADRFEAGEHSKFLISGNSFALTAADFNYQSLTAGGNGIWYAAMHIQNATGAGSGGSGWIGATVAPIPEPETYAMLLAGLGLLGFFARRRKERQ